MSRFSLPSAPPDRTSLWLLLRTWGPPLLIFTATLWLLDRLGDQDFAIVALFGLTVGATELAAQYRDAPLEAITTVPGMLYTLTNGLASAGALAVILLFDWNFGVEATEVEQLRWTRVLLAGFGAVALFRSSLFVRRVGNEDVNVGPSAVLGFILTAADRHVDRQRAAAIQRASSRIMAGQDYPWVYANVASAALVALQNMPEGDQTKLADSMRVIHESESMAEEAKSLALGSLLIQSLGEELAAQSMASLPSPPDPGV